MKRKGTMILYATLLVLLIFPFTMIVTGIDASEIAKTKTTILEQRLAPLGDNSTSTYIKFENYTGIYEIDNGELTQLKDKVADREWQEEFQKRYKDYYKAKEKQEQKEANKKHLERITSLIFSPLTLFFSFVQPLMNIELSIDIDFLGNTINSMTATTMFTEPEGAGVGSSDIDTPKFSIQSGTETIPNTIENVTQDPIYQQVEEEMLEDYGYTDEELPPISAVGLPFYGESNTTVEEYKHIKDIVEVKSDFEKETIITKSENDTIAIGLESDNTIMGIYTDPTDDTYRSGQYIIWTKDVDGTNDYSMNIPAFEIIPKVYVKENIDDTVWLESVLLDPFSLSMDNIMTENRTEFLKVYNEFTTNIFNSTWNIRNGIKIFHDNPDGIHFITEFMVEDKSFADIGVGYIVASSPYVKNTTEAMEKISYYGNGESLEAYMGDNTDLLAFGDSFLNATIMAKDNRYMNIDFSDMYDTGFTTPFMRTETTNLYNKTEDIFVCGMLNYGSYTNGSWVIVDPTVDQAIDTGGAKDGGSPRLYVAEYATSSYWHWYVHTELTSPYYVRLYRCSTTGTPSWSLWASKATSVVDLAHAYVSVRLSSTDDMYVFWVDNDYTGTAGHNSFKYCYLTSETDSSFSSIYTMGSGGITADGYTFNTHYQMMGNPKWIDIGDDILWWPVNRQRASGAWSNGEGYLVKWKGTDTTYPNAGGTWSMTMRSGRQNRGLNYPSVFTCSYDDEPVIFGQANYYSSGWYWNIEIWKGNSGDATSCTLKKTWNGAYTGYFSQGYYSDEWYIWQTDVDYGGSSEDFNRIFSDDDGESWSGDDYTTPDDDYYLTGGIVDADGDNKWVVFLDNLSGGYGLAAYMWDESADTFSDLQDMTALVPPTYYAWPSNFRQGSTDTYVCVTLEYDTISAIYEELRFSYYTVLTPPNTPTYVSGMVNTYGDKTFTLVTDHTDPDGVGDLDYGRFAIGASGGVYYSAKWNVDTDTLTELNNPTMGTCASPVTETGITNGYRLTWTISLGYNFPFDDADFDLYMETGDDAAQTANSGWTEQGTTTHETELIVYSTNFILEDSAYSDDGDTALGIGEWFRGGVGVKATGYVTYEGTTNVYPANTAVDVQLWVDNAGSTLTDCGSTYDDETLATGYFDITTYFDTPSDAVVDENFQMDIVLEDFVSSASQGESDLAVHEVDRDNVAPTGGSWTTDTDSDSMGNGISPYWDTYGGYEAFWDDDDVNSYTADASSWTDDSGVKDYRITSTGGSYGSYDTDGSNVACTFVGEGAKDITGQVRDNVGNVATADTSIDILFDTTAPTGFDVDFIGISAYTPSVPSYFWMADTTQVTSGDLWYNSGGSSTFTVECDASGTWNAGGEWKVWFGTGFGASPKTDDSAPYDSNVYTSDGFHELSNYIVRIINRNGIHQQLTFPITEDIVSPISEDPFTVYGESGDVGEMYAVVNADMFFFSNTFDTDGIATFTAEDGTDAGSGFSGVNFGSFGADGATFDSSSPYSDSYTINDADTTGSITVTWYDRVGNGDSDTITMTEDPDEPDLSVTLNFTPNDYVIKTGSDYGWDNIDITSVQDSVSGLDYGFFYVYDGGGIQSSVKWIVQGLAGTNVELDYLDEEWYPTDDVTSTGTYLADEYDDNDLYVRIGFRDMVGNYVYDITGYCKLDRTAPTGHSLAMESGTYYADITNDNTPLLTASGASDPGSGLHASPYDFAWRVNGGSWTYSGYQAGTTWSPTISTNSQDYDFALRVKDLVGNTDVYAYDSDNTFDNTNPAFTNIGSSESSLFLYAVGSTTDYGYYSDNMEGTPTDFYLIGDVTDNFGLEEASGTVAFGITPTDSTITGASDSFSLTYLPYDIHSGDKPVTVTLYDQAGNSVTDTFTFYEDNTPPSLSITWNFNANDWFIITGSDYWFGDIDITSLQDTGSGMQHVYVRVWDGVDYNTARWIDSDMGAVTTDEEYLNQYVYATETGESAGADLDDWYTVGTMYVLVWSRDMCYNSAYDTEYAKLDRTAPIIGTTEFTDDVYDTNWFDQGVDSEATFRIPFTESNVDSIEVVCTLDAVDRASDWVSGTTPFDSVISISGRSDTTGTAITITITDETGNTDTTFAGVNQIKLDDSAPTCTIATLTETSDYLFTSGTSTVWYGDDMTSAQNLEIAVTSTDSYSGVNFVNSTAVWFGDSPSDSGSPYTLDYTIENSDTDIGTLTVTSFDNVGNSLTDTIVVYRDTTNPITTFTQITEDSPYLYWDGTYLWISDDMGETTQYFTVEVSSNDGGSNPSDLYAVEFLETAWGDNSPQNDTGSPYSRIFEVTQNEANHTMIIKAVDNVGNWETTIEITIIDESGQAVELGIGVDVINEDTIYFYDLDNTTFYYGDGMSGEFNANFLAGWHFDENTSSTVYDLGPNSWDSSVTGATWVDGLWGSALDFENGDSTDKITITDHDDLSFSDGAGNDKPFSLSVWLNPETVSGSVIRNIFFKGTTPEYEIATYQSKVRVIFYDNGWTTFIGRQSAIDIPIGSWTHLVVTYDGSETSGGINIYFNGTDQTGGSYNNGVYQGMHPTSNPAYIGNRFSAFGFDGKMDEFSVWNESIGADTITSLYNNQISNNTVHFDLVYAYNGSSGISHVNTSVSWFDQVYSDSTAPYDLLFYINNTHTQTGTMTIYIWTNAGSNASDTVTIYRDTSVSAGTSSSVHDFRYTHSDLVDWYYGSNMPSTANLGVTFTSGEGGAGESGLLSVSDNTTLGGDPTPNTGFVTYVIDDTMGAIHGSFVNEFLFTDNCGNTDTITRNFWYDYTAPDFEITTITETSTYLYYVGSGSYAYYSDNMGASLQDFIIAGTASESEAWDTGYESIEDDFTDDTTFGNNPSHSGTSAWSFTYQIDQDDDSFGSFNITFTVRDEVYNLNTTWFYFYLDNDDPSIALDTTNIDENSSYLYYSGSGATGYYGSGMDNNNTIVYLHMDDGSGTTVTDFGWYGLDFSFGNTPEWYSSSVNAWFNYSLDFEADDDDYLYIVDNSLFSFTDGSNNDLPFSVGIWMKPETITGSYGVFGKGDAGNQEWYVNLRDGQVEFLIVDSAWDYISRYTLEDYVLGVDCWTNLIVTYDGSGYREGMRIYLNGTLADMIFMDGRMGAYDYAWDSATQFVIGDIYAGYGTTFDGLMDEFFFSREELNPAQIYMNYLGQTTHFNISGTVSSDSGAGLNTTFGIQDNTDFGLNPINIGTINNWFFDYNIHYNDSVDFGTVVVTYTVKDNVNNSDTVTFTFTLDTTAPSFTYASGNTQESSSYIYWDSSSQSAVFGVGTNALGNSGFENITNSVWDMTGTSSIYGPTSNTPFGGFYGRIGGIGTFEQSVTSFVAISTTRLIYWSRSTGYAHILYSDGSNTTQAFPNEWWWRPDIIYATEGKTVIGVHFNSTVSSAYIDNVYLIKEDPYIEVGGTITDAGSDVFTVYDNIFFNNNPIGEVSSGDWYLNYSMAFTSIFDAELIYSYGFAYDIFNYTFYGLDRTGNIAYDWFKFYLDDTTPFINLTLEETYENSPFIYWDGTNEYMFYSDNMGTTLTSFIINGTSYDYDLINAIGVNYDFSWYNGWQPTDEFIYWNSSSVQQFGSDYLIGQGYAYFSTIGDYLNRSFTAIPTANITEIYFYANYGADDLKVTLMYTDSTNTSQTYTGAASKDWIYFTNIAVGKTANMIRFEAVGAGIYLDEVHVMYSNFASNSMSDILNIVDNTSFGNNPSNSGNNTNWIFDYQIDQDDSGNYYVTFTVTDKTNNANTTNSFYFYEDTTAPTGTYTIDDDPDAIDDLGTTSGYYNDTTIDHQINGVQDGSSPPASGLNATHTYSYRIDSGAWGDWNTTTTMVTTLTEGTHIISIAIKDNVNNTRIYTITAYVDLTKPVLDDLDWYDAQYSDNFYKNTFNIAHANLSWTDVYLTHINMSSTLLGYLQDITSPSGNYSIFSATITGAISRYYNMTIELYDSAGNFNIYTSTGSQTLYVDDESPSGTFARVEDAHAWVAGYTNDSTFWVGISSYNDGFNGSGATATPYAYNLNGAGWEAWTSDVLEDWTASDDNHTLGIKLIDNLGNEQAYYTWYLVDTVYPVLGWLTLNESYAPNYYDQLVSTAARATIGFTENNTYHINATCALPHDDDLDMSGTPAIIDFNITLQSDGAYAISIIIYDKAGNTDTTLLGSEAPIQLQAGLASTDVENWFYFYFFRSDAVGLIWSNYNVSYVLDEDYRNYTEQGIRGALFAQKYLNITSAIRFIVRGYFGDVIVNQSYTLPTSFDLYITLPVFTLKVANLYDEVMNMTIERQDSTTIYTEQLMPYEIFSWNVFAAVYNVTTYIHDSTVLALDELGNALDDFQISLATSDYALFVDAPLRFTELSNFFSEIWQLNILTNKDHRVTDVSINIYVNDTAQGSGNFTPGIIILSRPQAGVYNLTVYATWGNYARTYYRQITIESNAEVTTFVISGVQAGSSVVLVAWNTNKGTGTLYVKDNGTLIATDSTEGSYKWDKSETIGIHTITFHVVVETKNFTYYTDYTVAEWSAIVVVHLYDSATQYVSVDQYHTATITVTTSDERNFNGHIFLNDTLKVISIINGVGTFTVFSADITRLFYNVTQARYTDLTNRSYVANDLTITFDELVGHIDIIALTGNDVEISVAFNNSYDDDFVNEFEYAVYLDNKDIGSRQSSSFTIENVPVGVHYVTLRRIRSIDEPYVDTGRCNEVSFEIPQDQFQEFVEKDLGPNIPIIGILVVALVAGLLLRNRSKSKKGSTNWLSADKTIEDKFNNGK